MKRGLLVRVNGETELSARDERALTCAIFFCGMFASAVGMDCDGGGEILVCLRTARTVRKND